jgi:DinB family protein
MTSAISSRDSDDPMVILLDREHRAFLEQLERVPQAKRDVRLKQESWSAAEIVEHLARLERGVGKLILVKSAEPLTASADELLRARLSDSTIAMVRNRAVPIEAPERVRPTGTVSSEDALAQLNDARAALKQAYASTDPSILDGAVHEHPVLGPLTIRDWVELTGHHEARHAGQMAELADGWA